MTPWLRRLVYANLRQTVTQNHLKKSFLENAKALGLTKTLQWVMRWTIWLVASPANFNQFDQQSVWHSRKSSEDKNHQCAIQGSLEAVRQSELVMQLAYWYIDCQHDNGKDSHIYFVVHFYFVLMIQLPCKVSINMRLLCTGSIMIKFNQSQSLMQHQSLHVLFKRVCKFR